MSGRRKVKTSPRRLTAARLLSDKSYPTSGLSKGQVAYCLGRARKQKKSVKAVLSSFRAQLRIREKREIRAGVKRIPKSDTVDGRAVLDFENRVARAFQVERDFGEVVPRDRLYDEMKKLSKRYKRQLKEVVTIRVDIVIATGEGDVIEWRSGGFVVRDTRNALPALPEDEVERGSGFAQKRAIDALLDSIAQSFGKYRDVLGFRRLLLYSRNAFRAKKQARWYRPGLTTRAPGA